MPFLGELMPQHFSLTFHATTNDLDNPRKNALPCHVYWHTMRRLAHVLWFSGPWIWTHIISIFPLRTRKHPFIQPWNGPSSHAIWIWFTNWVTLHHNIGLPESGCPVTIVLTSHTSSLWSKENLCMKRGPPWKVLPRNQELQFINHLSHGRLHNPFDVLTNAATAGLHQQSRLATFGDHLPWCCWCMKNTHRSLQILLNWSKLLEYIYIIIYIFNLYILALSIWTWSPIQGFSAPGLLQNGLPRFDTFREVLGPARPGRWGQASVEAMHSVYQVVISPRIWWRITKVDARVIPPWKKGNP